MQPDDRLIQLMRIVFPSKYENSQGLAGARIYAIVECRLGVGYL